METASYTPDAYLQLLVAGDSMKQWHDYARDGWVGSQNGAAPGWRGGSTGTHMSAVQQRSQRRKFGSACFRGLVRLVPGSLFRGVSQSTGVTGTSRLDQTAARPLVLGIPGVCKLMFHTIWTRS